MRPSSLGGMACSCRTTSSFGRASSCRIALLVQGAADQEYDVDSFNAPAVAAIGEQTFGEVRARLEESHAQLVTVLDGLDEAAFAPGGATHEWVTALTRHSREHARELDGGGPHGGLPS